MTSSTAMFRPKVNSIWRHRKTQTPYLVLGHARFDGGQVEDYSELVVFWRNGELRAAIEGADEGTAELAKPSYSAKMQIAAPKLLSTVPLVIYRELGRPDEQVWVRLGPEFLDGRFEKVSS